MGKRPPAAGRGRPKGALNRRTREAQELAAALIDGDPEYLENLKQRIKAGKAPHMEQLLWHYRFGKPREQIDVRVQSDWDKLAARLASVRQRPPGPLEDSVDAEVVAPALPEPKQTPDRTAPDMSATEAGEGDAPEQAAASHPEEGEARSPAPLKTPTEAPPRRRARELFTGRVRRDLSWMRDY